VQLRRAGGLSSQATQRLKCAPRTRALRVSANLYNLTPKDVVVEQTLGKVGFLTVSSWPPREMDATQGFDLAEAASMGKQDLEPGSVEARLYAGRIVTGPGANARVVLKAYPSRRSNNGLDADAMAANEFVTLASMQPPVVPREKMSPNLVKLLGGFVATEGATAGEQWLVFRNDGQITAASYAAEAAQATAESKAVGNPDFLDNMMPERPIARRQTFIKVILYKALCGLGYLHAKDRLHQSLGPQSLVLSTVDEQDVATLQVRLQDFAFAVDISEEALTGGLSLDELLERGPAAATSGRRVSGIEKLSVDLWRRGDEAGARTVAERRQFGMADDVYGLGLLMAYMAFVPFSTPGSIDAPTLLKTLEGTFRLDVMAASDFFAADDRYKLAVGFLDRNQKAGWKLLQKMLDPDWRKRPTVDEILADPFFTTR